MTVIFGKAIVRRSPCTSPALTNPKKSPQSLSLPQSYRTVLAHLGKSDRPSSSVVRTHFPLSLSQISAFTIANDCDLFQIVMQDVPENSIHPKTRSEWRQWLIENHFRTQGIWLISYKKATGKARFDYNEAVEEALCFGWIDSKPNKLDESRSLLWFAPRKFGTGWSKLNKERIERLIATGLMTAVGMAKIEAAKQDGSWTALDGIESLEIPIDLAQALSSYPSAQQNFEAFPRSAKRGILEWIATAKKSETRAKRIEDTAKLASDNIRANQWRS